MPSTGGSGDPAGDLLAVKDCEGLMVPPTAAPRRKGVSVYVNGFTNGGSFKAWRSSTALPGEGLFWEQAYFLTGLGVRSHCQFRKDQRKRRQLERLAEAPYSLKRFSRKFQRAARTFALLFVG